MYSNCPYEHTSWRYLANLQRKPNSILWQDDRAVLAVLKGQLSLSKFVEPLQRLYISLADERSYYFYK